MVQLAAPEPAPAATAGVRRLLVVDMLNMAYAVTRGATRSPEAMTRRVLAETQRVVAAAGASDVIFATDAGGDTFREPIRDITHSVVRFARQRRRLRQRGELPDNIDTPSADEVLARMALRSPGDAPRTAKLWRVSELLGRLGYVVVEAPGYEADDVIATLVELARPRFDSIAVVSNDRDLRTLADGGQVTVFAYSSRARRVVGHRQPRNGAGLTSAQRDDLMALCGAGRRFRVSGAIDRTTATRLLLEHGSLPAIFAALERIEPTGLRERLAAKRADIEQLAAYAPLRRDVPLEIDWPATALPRPVPADPALVNDFGARLLAPATELELVAAA
jgi:hypothetical protein